MVANCTLAKCSEEHVNHKKQQSHVYPEFLQYALFYSIFYTNLKCTNVTIQLRHHSRNSNSLRLKAKYRNMAKFLMMTLFSVNSNKTS